MNTEFPIETFVVLLPDAIPSPGVVINKGSELEMKGYLLMGPSLRVNFVSEH